MNQHFPLKLLISLAALVFIIIHLLWPALPVDAITIGLLVVLLLPWISTLLESAELPGGWKVKFREMQVEQKQHGEDIAMLKFLMAHFLTDDEIAHLNKLATGAPFPFTISDTTKYFELELRHLRALGLIAGNPGKGVRSLLKYDGDVKDHFYITERGREYLQLRAQAEEPGEMDSPD